jgi:hypothetical protein
MPVSEQVAQLRRKVAKLHTPKGMARGERAEVRAGAAEIVRRFLQAVKSRGFVLNRVLTEAWQVEALLNDAAEQLGKVLLEGLGPDPEPATKDGRAVAAKGVA